MRPEGVLGVALALETQSFGNLLALVMFKSKGFSDWVCSEVFPSTFKTGNLLQQQYLYNKSSATEDDVRQPASARGRKDILPYDILEHVGT